MSKVIPFLKQVRIINLLMLVLVQFITNYVFVKNVSSFHLALISLATVLIAAGGYIINDIYDFEIDKINKSQLEHSKPSLRIYKALSFLALIIGLYLSIISDFVLINYFTMAFGLLFLYARYLSKYKVIGNVLISLLIAEAIIIIPFFLNALQSESLLPIENPLLLEYMGFAFFLNWIREIIKDLEDQKGDEMFGRYTLPILIGEFYTKLIVVCLVVVTTLLLSKSIFAQSNLILVPIGIGFLVLMLFTMIARNKADFKRLSILLKIVMLYGLLSPLFL